MGLFEQHYLENKDEIDARVNSRLAEKENSTRSSVSGYVPVGDFNRYSDPSRQPQINRHHMADIQRQIDDHNAQVNAFARRAKAYQTYQDRMNMDVEQAKRELSLRGGEMTERQTMIDVLNAQDWAKQNGAIQRHIAQLETEQANEKEATNNLRSRVSEAEALQTAKAPMTASDANALLAERDAVIGVYSKWHDKLNRAEQERALIYNDPNATDEQKQTADKKVAQVKSEKETAEKLMHGLYGKSDEAEYISARDKLLTEPRYDAYYTHARTLQSDLEKVQALDHYVKYGSGDPKKILDEYKPYLFEKYGIIENSLTMDTFAELYERLKAQRDREIGELIAAGYDYERMAEYEEQQKRNAKMAEEIAFLQEQAKKHPLHYSVSSIGDNIAAGGDFIGAWLMSLGRNDPRYPTTYRVPQATDYENTAYVNAVRDTVANEVIDTGLGRFFYQAGMSMADSATALSASLIAGAPRAAALMLSMPAASHAAKDAVSRGASTTQALNVGFAAGVAEALFESIGIESLFKIKSVVGLKGVVKATLKQSGVEATEEVLTEITNIIYDGAHMKEKSHYELAVRKMMDDDPLLTKEEAQKRALLDQVEQVALAGASGFVSGIGFGGATSLSNYTLDGEKAGTAEDSATQEAILEELNRYMQQGSDFLNYRPEAQQPAQTTENTTAAQPTQSQQQQKTSPVRDNARERNIDLAQTIDPQQAQRLSVTVENILNEAKWEGVDLTNYYNETNGIDMDAMTVDDVATIATAIENVVEELGNTSLLSVPQIIRDQFDIQTPLQNDIANGSQVDTAAEQAFLLDNESERFVQDVEQGERLPPSVGATDYDPDSYSSFLTRSQSYYQPRDNSAVRPVDTPMYGPNGEKISRVPDTAMGAGIVTDAGVQDIEQGIMDGVFNITTITDQDSYDRAVAYIDSPDVGYNAARAETMTALELGNGASKDTIVTGFELVRRAYQASEEAKKSGNVEEQHRLQSEAMEMLVALQKKITNAAQMLQSVGMMRSLTPEGRLMGLQKTVARINGQNGGMSSVDQQIVLRRLQEQYQTALNLIENIHEAFDQSGKKRNHGLPFEKWADAIGKQLARAVEPKANAENTTRVSQQIKQDLLKFARPYLQKAQGGAKRTYTDVLADFFAHRKMYTEAWSKAKRELYAKYGDDPQFNAFINSDLDFIGSDTDNVMIRAIAEAATEQELKARDIDIRSYLGDRADVVDTIANALIQKTDAKGGNAQLIRNVVERYVTEHTKGDGEKIVGRDIKATLKEMGMDISQIIRAANGDKAVVASQISDLLVDKYGVSAEASSDAANTIVEQFSQMVAERSENALESMFKDRPPKVRKTLAKQFEELANMGAFTNSQWEAQVTEKLFGGGVKVDPDLAAEFVNEQDPDEREKIFNEILLNIGEQMPTTFGEVIDQIRYTNMLIGPSTHIKNVTSNVTQTALKLTKDFFKVGIEKIINEKTDGRVGRTVALIDMRNAEDRAKYEKGLADFENVKEIISHAQKWSSENDKIREGRTVMKLNDPKNKVERGIDKVLRGYDKVSKLNSAALNAEDMLLAKPNYAISLAQYMKANNLTEITNEAREYAVQEAKRVTLRDQNTVSAFARKFVGQKGLVGFLAKAVAPFAPTNANYLVRMFEYSPIGAIRTLAMDKARVERGEITASQAIDNLAAGITGTLAWGLGAILAHLKILRYRGVGDEKEKREQRRLGAKDFSIWNLPIEWLGNGAVQLMAGASIYEAIATRKLDGDHEFSLSVLLQGIEGLLEPALQSSMFEGIQKIFTTSRDNETPLSSSVFDIAGNMARSYLLSIISPTPIRRIASAVDTYARETWVDKNKDETGQKTVQEFLRNTPFASKTQKQRVDIHGDPVYGGVITKPGSPLEVFDPILTVATPVFPGKKIATEVDNEIAKLYRDPEVDTDGLTVFLPAIPKSFEVDGEKVYLTADQATRYETDRNKGATQLKNTIYKSDLYDKLPKQARMVVMSIANEYAMQRAKDNLDIGTSHVEWVDDLADATDDEIATAIIEKALTSNGVSGYGDQDRASRYRNSIYDMRNWGESNDVLDRAMENATAYNDALARQGMGFDIESDWMLKLADLSEKEQADAFIAKAVQDEADEVKNDHKDEGWNRYDGLAWLYDEGIIGDDEAKLGMSNRMQTAYDNFSDNGKAFTADEMIDVYAYADKVAGTSADKLDAAVQYIRKEWPNDSKKALALFDAMEATLIYSKTYENEVDPSARAAYGSEGQKAILAQMTDNQQRNYDKYVKNSGVTAYEFELALKYKGEHKKDEVKAYLARYGYTYAQQQAILNGLYKQK